MCERTCIINESDDKSGTHLRHNQVLNFTVAKLNSSNVTQPIHFRFPLQIWNANPKNLAVANIETFDSYTRNEIIFNPSPGTISFRRWAKHTSEITYSRDIVRAEGLEDESFC